MSSDLASQKFNSDNKKTIRSKWAKAIIGYLHTKLSKKLIYLGLPDVEAHDVIEWLDYIDSVFAFQCREYPKPSSSSQDRKNVLALENTLRTLERRKQISTFDVFDGYIEEVVVRGYDNTPTTKEYTQQDTITIYNLDFCGQVTSPIEYTDKNGNKAQAYKFNAVDRLLNFQRNVEFPNKKFIMFLTLHCSYDGKEFSNFIANPHNADIENYIRPIKSKPKGEKSPYLVKAFVYDQLTKFFTQNHFLPEFLPTIYYKGDNSHPLLFFTIIGTQVINSSGIPTPHYKMKDILNKPFISITDEGDFIANTDLGLEADTSLGAPIDAVHFFKNSKTHKTLWK